MYNKQWKAWDSGEYEDTLLLWCKEPYNRDNPQALYVLADTALAEASKGHDTADAVYNMERAANLGYGQAALAMGQLFQFGWAVHRSIKKAELWYKKAAELGNKEAQAYIDNIRRQRQRRILCYSVGALGLVLIIAACIWFFRPPREGVLVHENTVLLEPATMEEFNQALGDLVEQYDNEMVVSGQRSTNRLLLKFQGEGIDLTDFPAATVIVDDTNYLIIQFETEEEAQRCLDQLMEDDNILFVEMDEYSITTAAVTPEHKSGGVPYDSLYSDVIYYSWGVEYLGLDRLAGWLMGRTTSPVTVAVLDTGVEPCDENAYCILEGTDVTSNTGNGWQDQEGHGTHVAGTIIDCTWGLDVNILPVRVFVGSTTSNSFIVQGLQYAIQMDVDVINMSLGGPCTQTVAGTSCGSAIDYFIAEAWDSGITVVVAAGNGDEYGIPVDTSGECPAHIDKCIVVAACDSTGGLGSFSNYGESVDVTAPGVDIISYYPGGTLQSLSGTSMAAPHISALVAMLKLYMPDKTPEQIERYITDYCTYMGYPLSYGEGIPWAEYFAGE